MTCHDQQEGNSHKKHIEEKAERNTPLNELGSIEQEFFQ